MLDRFYYEVLQPWIRLEERAGQNICVSHRFSDVVYLGYEAAIAAYHHWEKAKRVDGSSSVEGMSTPRAEWLRKRLGELSDSAKHVTLRAKQRQTTVETALGFEFNDEGYFRFLRTILLARNDMVGEFDVAEVLTEYLSLLCADLGYPVDIKREQPAGIFMPNVVTFFRPQPFITIPSTDYIFFKRNELGELERADPPEVRIEVLEKQL